MVQQQLGYVLSPLRTCTSGALRVSSTSRTVALDIWRHTCAAAADSPRSTARIQATYRSVPNTGPSSSNTRAKVRFDEIAVQVTPRGMAEHRAIGCDGDALGGIEARRRRHDARAAPPLPLTCLGLQIQMKPRDSVVAPVGDEELVPCDSKGSWLGHVRRCRHRCTRRNGH